jgi:hypothetical protein
MLPRRGSSIREGSLDGLVTALVAEAPTLCTEQVLALRLLIHGSSLSKAVAQGALERSGRKPAAARVSSHG